MDDFIGGIIFGFVIARLIFCVWISFIYKDWGYKKGQVDCLNGIVKYELQKQNDNSELWVEIKDSK